MSLRYRDQQQREREADRERERQQLEKHSAVSGNLVPSPAVALGTHFRREGPSRMRPPPSSSSSSSSSSDRPTSARHRPPPPSTSSSSSRSRSHGSSSSSSSSSSSAPKHAPFRHQVIREKYGEPHELETWATRTYAGRLGFAFCIVNRVQIESRYGAVIDAEVDGALAAYLAHRATPEAAEARRVHRARVVEAAAPTRPPQRSSPPPPPPSSSSPSPSTAATSALAKS